MTHAIMPMLFQSLNRTFMTRTYTFLAIRMLLSCCFMLFAQTSLASNHDIDCPAHIPVENIQTNGGPDVWSRQLKSAMPFTANELNNRPRKRLGYKTPAQLLSEVTAARQFER